MKKTIITLLALGSCAMGITLDDATLSFTTSDLVPAKYITPQGEGAEAGAIQPNGDKCITIAVTLDVNVLKGYLSADESQHMIVGIKGAGGAGDYTTGVVSNGSGNNIGVLSGRWGDNYNYDGKTFMTGLNSPTTWSWDDVAGAAMTYVFNGNDTVGDVAKGTSVFLTLVNEDNTILYEQNSTIGGLVSTGATYKEVYFDTSVVTSAYTFNTAVGTADGKSLTSTLAASSIPEPATATLSLLALAGLAARRRRH